MVSGRLASSLLNGASPNVKVETLLDSAVDFTLQVLTANKCSLMLLLKETGELVIKKARGLDEETVSKTRLRLGDGIAGWVALNRQPVLAEDAQSVPNLVRRNSTSYTTNSFVSAPVIANGTVGVLNVADKRDGRAFSSSDLRLLEQIASLVGDLLGLQAMIKTLQETSVTDPLTGLGNRRYFELRLSQDLARARRYGQDLALLLMSIDRFENVNHLVGHEAGSQIIQSVGACLEREIRRSDTIARVSGDEFAIVLPETGADTAESVAERLVGAVARQLVPEIPNGLATLSLSGGISSYPAHAVDEDQMISQARAALYMSKRSQTQRVQTWRQTADRLLEAQELGIPYLAAPAEMLTAEVSGLIPLEMARQYCCVPVGFERGNLTVAVLDPTESELLENLARVTRRTIHPVVSGLAEIIAALNRLAELQGKRAAAEISVRKAPHRECELKIAVKPLANGADLEHVMRELAEVCSGPNVRIKSAESYVVTVVAASSNCSRVLKDLRRIPDLLIESVRTDDPQHSQVADD